VAIYNPLYTILLILHLPSMLELDQNQQSEHRAANQTFYRRVEAEFLCIFEPVNPFIPR